MAMDWDRLDIDKYQDERKAVAALLASQPLSPAMRTVVQSEAAALVTKARQMDRRAGMVESFLQEFSLSTPEGLALMGLAEALLRTPDAGTRDRLIAEKISAADWAAHLGQSGQSAGQCLDLGPDADRAVDRCQRAWTMRPAQSAGWRRGWASRSCARRWRKHCGSWVNSSCWAAPSTAALARAASDNLLCSFDMLGEGARTEADAERYEAAYAQAIAAIGKAATGPENGHGISVKLSALSPRYEATQEARVWTELYPAPEATGRYGGKGRHQFHDRCRGSRPAGAVAEAAGQAGARAVTGRLAWAWVWRFKPTRSGRPR